MTYFLTTKTLHKILAATLFYITLPSILFVLSLPLSTPSKMIAAGLLFYSFTKALKAAKKHAIIGPSDGYYLKSAYILMAVGILTLSYWSLFCGHGFVGDWNKHRAILLSLYKDPFKPTLNGFEFSPALSHLKNAPLVYYYAMYLPITCLIKSLLFFFKITSIDFLLWLLSFAFFAWNLLGLILAFLLVPLICKRIFAGISNKATGGIFILILVSLGSLRYWYGVFTEKKLYLGHTGWVLPYLASVPSVFSQWQWAPNQLVVGLLGVVLILLYQSKIKRLPLTIYTAFLFSSSPWCLIGLFPTVLYILFKEFTSNRMIELKRRALDFLKENVIELLSAALISLMMITFYNTKVYPLRFELNPTLMNKNGFLKYLLYLLMEFFPVVVIIILGAYKKIAMPWIIRIQLATLFLMPLFNSGAWNDLVLKSTSPAFWLVTFYLTYVIQESIQNKSTITKILLGIYFIAVIPLFLNELYMGLCSRSNLLTDQYYIISQYQGKTGLGNMDRLR